MKIFIASSKESIELMREIEMWIQEDNHEPMPWDQPGLFPPGEQTFLTLINISKQIDRAICVFNEDDRIWYRGDAAAQPRDNILIEYGLFAGALGPTKAIICRHGTPKHSTDLQGITFIDLNQDRKARGRIELIKWIRRQDSSYPVDSEILRLNGRIGALEREKEALEQIITFEKDKSNDLEVLLKRGKIIDFTIIDLEKDGYWKLLFKNSFFNGAVVLLAHEWSFSDEGLRGLLLDAGLREVADKIAWEANYGRDRGSFVAGKVLRVFRYYFNGETFLQFIKEIPGRISCDFEKLANSVLATPGSSSSEPG